MSTVRQKIGSRWIIATIDQALHVAAALLLGTWWMQWLPDLLLPVLLIHGLTTNRWLPETSWVMKTHKFMHTIWPAVLIGVIAVVTTLDSVILPLCVHWFVHIFIDQLTHPEGKFRRSLA